MDNLIAQMDATTGDQKEVRGDDSRLLTVVAQKPSWSSTSPPSLDGDAVVHLL
jgi:hypothetical protein